MHLTKRLPFSMALITFLALLPPALAQSANPHAVSLYNLGLSAYKQGSPESAIIFFKRAADIDPDLADAQYNLGVLYQSQRRLKEAVPRFQEVLRVKPTDQDAHFQLGVAFMDLNNLDQAKNEFLSITTNSSHYAEATQKIASISAQIANQASQTTQTAADLTSRSSDNNQSQSPPQNLSNQATNQTIATPQTVLQTPAPPATLSINNAAENNPAVAVVNPIQASSNPPPAPAANSSPTEPIPVLANASVQLVAKGFSAPSGLAFDKQGNLYVANFLTNSIDRIGADGTRTSFISGVNLKGPIGLVSDSEGNLYVANYLAGTIARINPAGITSIVATGFKKPYYLTLDPEGNLLVSQQEDNSVVRITLKK